MDGQDVINFSLSALNSWPLFFGAGVCIGFVLWFINEYLPLVAENEELNKKINETLANMSNDMTAGHSSIREDVSNSNSSLSILLQHIISDISTLEQFKIDITNSTASSSRETHILLNSIMEKLTVADNQIRENANMIRDVREKVSYGTSASTPIIPVPRVRRNRYDT